MEFAQLAGAGFLRNDETLTAQFAACSTQPLGVRCCSTGPAARRSAGARVRARAHPTEPSPSAVPRFSTCRLARRPVDHRFRPGRSLTKATLGHAPLGPDLRPGIAGAACPFEGSSESLAGGGRWSLIYSARGGTEVKNALGIPAMHALALFDVDRFGVIVGCTFNEAVGERAEFSWRPIAECQLVRRGSVELKFGMLPCGYSLRTSG